MCVYHLPVNALGPQTHGSPWLDRRPNDRALHSGGRRQALMRRFISNGLVRALHAGAGSVTDHRLTSGRRRSFATFGRGWSFATSWHIFKSREKLECASNNLWHELFKCSTYRATAVI